MSDKPKMSAPTLPDDFKVVKRPLEAGQEYHAFISHGDSDLDTSRVLLKALEERGFKCFHSDRDFMPGTSIVANMALGIKKSQKVILLVSKKFLSSMYCDFEVSEALHQSFEKKKRVLIPVLLDVEPADVPSSIKQVNYIEVYVDGYFERLVRALADDSPLSTIIPAGQVGVGLAWSYYYGYLKLILPGLRERAENSDYAKKDLPFLKKFVCILTETSNCPTSMIEEDSNICTVGKGIKFTVTRAGNIDRDYTTAVHQVTDPNNGKVYQFMGEFCTPLKSMYEMEEDGISGLDRRERVYQTMVFRDKIKEIMAHPKAAEFADNILLLPYRDADVQTSSESKAKECLSERLVKAIQHELAKESRINDESIRRPTFRTLNGETEL